MNEDDEHVGRSGWPAVLEPMTSVLADAHEGWHDTADAYHDPRVFRRRLEELIQLLRNSTFRLQSMKGELPGFEQWYPPWQDAFRASSSMRWLNEARVEVVKKSGLRTASRAVVCSYSSYLEAPVVRFEVPATVATEQIVARVRKAVPTAAKPHTAIEIARRWEVPEFPSQDLLSVLRDCWTNLHALAVYAAQAVIGCRPADSPEKWLASHPSPVCMETDPSLVSVLVAADSGETLGYQQRVVARHDAVIEQVARRYKAPEVNMSSPAAELAEALHEHARAIFKKDGTHYPFLYLRRPDGSWELHSSLAEDKRAKFVMWHHYGFYVAQHRHDALIFTSEVWASTMRAAALEPYASIEDLPGRREQLVTWLETRDGLSLSWTSDIVRFAGRPFLKAPRGSEDSKADAREPGFTAPIRRAWQNHQHSHAFRGGGGRDGEGRR